MAVIDFIGLMSTIAPKVDVVHQLTIYEHDSWYEKLDKHQQIEIKQTFIN